MRVCVRVCVCMRVGIYAYEVRIFECLAGKIICHVIMCIRTYVCTYIRMCVYAVYSQLSDEGAGE